MDKEERERESERNYGDQLKEKERVLSFRFFSR